VALRAPVHVEAEMLRYGPHRQLTGDTGHFERKSARDDDFVQAGDLYR
jgi:hypothetical protein